MKKLNKDIPLIYVFLYSKFRKNLVGSPYVRPSYLLGILKRICRVPKALHYPILKEMEKFELIKRINHQSWEVLSHSCNKRLDKYPFKSDRPWN